MSKTNPSMLDSLLATAAAQAEAAQAAADAEAKRMRKAEKTEATKATDNMFAVVAQATGNAMASGGHPAVTNLMNNLANFAVSGGAMPAPTAQPSVSQTDSGTDQETNRLLEELDGANGTIVGLREQLDGAQATISDLEASVATITSEKEAVETELEAANHANRDLRTQVEGKNAELRDKQTELDTVTIDRDRIQRELDAAQSSVQPLREENDDLQQQLVDIKTQVKALPEIDLSRKVFGSGGKEIKVPFADAERLNNGRVYLRQVLGLDPTPAPAEEEDEPADVPAGEHPVPGMQ